MRRKLITAGLGILALLFLADLIGGDATSIPWAMIIGLPIVALIAAYLVYLSILKVSGRSANAEHDKRVGKRMPKIIVGGIIALTLAGAIPHYGSILLAEAKAQAGQAAGGVASSFEDSTTSASAVLPPAWVMVTVPILVVAAIWFVARGEDAEAKTVRGTAVGLAALASIIVTIATAVIA
jgi:hypothetical protein